MFSFYISWFWAVWAGCCRWHRRIYGFFPPAFPSFRSWELQHYAPKEVSCSSAGVQVRYPVLCSQAGGWLAWAITVWCLLASFQSRPTLDMLVHSYSMLKLYFLQLLYVIFIYFSPARVPVSSSEEGVIHFVFKYHFYPKPVIYSYFLKYFAFHFKKKTLLLKFIW